MQMITRISTDNFLRLEVGSALVVIAHPDDETIWMSGTIIMNPRAKWTIFSLCRASDSDRAPKFRKACKFYGAEYIISDLEDEGVMSIRESVPEIEKRIKKLLPARHFDYVFTHGFAGEYGHPRHKGVNRATRALATSHWLQARKFFTFAYRFSGEKKFAVPDIGRATHVMKLTEGAFKRKREVIEKIYGFGRRSFEYRSCASTETFFC